MVPPFARNPYRTHQENDDREIGTEPFSPGIHQMADDMPSLDSVAETSSGAIAGSANSGPVDFKITYVLNVSAETSLEDLAHLIVCVRRSTAKSIGPSAFQSTDK
mgnify:CR=1 FL=1